MAKAAVIKCEGDTTFPELLEAICQEARKALRETQNELPELKASGVVDAGASGLVLFIEGMRKYSMGEAIEDKETLESSSVVASVEEKIIEEYCVEFMLSGGEINTDKLIKTLTDIGHSIIVDRGEGDRYKIHIHASDPKKVFDRTSRFGKPAYIKVDDLSRAQKEYIKKIKA